MRLCSALALLGGLMLVGPALADDGIQLEIKGTVKTGLFAIGGETTGVVIGTKGGFGCELDGANDEKYNGKTCVVSGTYAVKAGVEVKQRAILKVNKIEVAEKGDDNFVKATVTGEVKTGVAAPGGQTTGVTITAGGVTWELDAGKNKDAAAALEKLNGKKAVVVGTVEVVKPMAAPPRPRTVVTVTEVKSVDK
jgi:hypothetical protein